MKRIIVAVGLLCVASFASAISITAPAGMIGTSALNGTYAYTWTVASGPLVSGATVNSASLVFTGITLTSSGSGHDLSYDVGRVFSGMVARPSTLPTPGNYGTYTDNDAAGDAFDPNVVNGNARHLDTQTLTRNQTATWTYTFLASDLTALNSYASQGSWGFLIDPDCLFNVGGITFNYTTTPNGGGGHGAPDGGTTGVLLGIALLGLGWAKQRISA